MTEQRKTFKRVYDTKEEEIKELRKLAGTDTKWSLQHSGFEAYDTCVIVDANGEVIASGHPGFPEVLRYICELHNNSLAEN